MDTDSLGIGKAVFSVVCFPQWRQWCVSFNFYSFTVTFSWVLKEKRMRASLNCTSCYMMIIQTPPTHHAEFISVRLQSLFNIQLYKQTWMPAGKNNIDKYELLYEKNFKSCHLIFPLRPLSLSLSGNGRDCNNLAYVAAFIMGASAKSTKFKMRNKNASPKRLQYEPNTLPQDHSTHPLR